MTSEMVKCACVDNSYTQFNQNKEKDYTLQLEQRKKYDLHENVFNQG